MIAPALCTCDFRVQVERCPVHGSRHTREMLEGYQSAAARMVRLFNRLDAAISHHKRDTQAFTSDADERLYVARERIISDWAQGKG